MSDLFEVIPDDERTWSEVAGDAQQILHAVLDSERPVDVDDEGYEYGQVA